MRIPLPVFPVYTDRVVTKGLSKGTLSMNCLIVEDNDQMRRLLCYLLREVADGGITECNDGGEALAAYEQCQPDVVVMDVQMANTDGIAATKEICAAHPDLSAQVEYGSNQRH